MVQDLSLQSPAPQRLQHYHPSNMSPHRKDYLEGGDDVGPLSPGNKRRRYNGDHPTTVTRAMPPRYGIATHGLPIGPGTPFPFGQVSPPSHGYPHTVVHTRRESLPALRGIVSPPGTMAPPPRPGMGYSQHRQSQGHIAPDRSLTLPPIQTAHAADQPLATGDIITTAKEPNKRNDFRYKLKVLSQVAPPASRTRSLRGPLIAVESDSTEAATALADWLKGTLGKDDDLRLHVVESPDVAVQGSKEQMMAQCHRLAAEWLNKSNDILASLIVQGDIAGDAAMTDVSTEDPSQGASSKPSDVDNNSHPGDCASQVAEKRMSIPDGNTNTNNCSTSTSNTSTPNIRLIKPVCIVANYSLHASNLFASAIPIGGTDPYSPNDHWQWAATQWRGIIGPDLTIYVCDASTSENGRPAMEIEGVSEKGRAVLFVVKRAKDDHQATDSEPKNAAVQLEPFALRRIGFEVSEWVKAFGSGKS